MKSATYIKKNIKTLVLILCLNLIQLTPKSVLAEIGTDGGGGGVGVKCTRNHQTSVTLLDVYEAEHVYGFGKPDDFGSITKNILEWTARESRAQGSEPDPDFWQVEKIITGLFEPVKHLKLIGDFSKWGDLKPGCEYVQIAKYVDPPHGSKLEDIWKNSKIEIVMSLYEKLDNVGKASLILHEYNYFRNRYLSYSQKLAKGSDDARIVSAALMTNMQDFVILSKYNLPNFTCQFGNFLLSTNEWTNTELPTHLYALNETYNGASGVRLYFQWFYGYYVHVKSSAFVPSVSIDQLKAGKLNAPITIDVKADLEIPNVKTQTYKLKLEKSDELNKPLRITPISHPGSPTTGFCG